jgi:hypothetical protein
MKATLIPALLLAAAPFWTMPAQAQQRQAPLHVFCMETQKIKMPAPLPADPGDTVGSQPAVCGHGKVPQPLGRFSPKGLPAIERHDVPGVDPVAPEVPGVDSAEEIALDYFYNAAYQTGSATGSQAKFTQHQPVVGVQDYHSLIEMSGESADGSNIIEVGWTVDPGLNGDDLPHLFVFHWVNSNPTCYNGCGFVQVSETRFPGMPVTVTTTPQKYAFKWDGSNWWVGYQGEWIGYFPGDLWNGEFARLGFSQWFGEVASGSTEPCTQMGSGEFGSGIGSAKVGSEKFGGSSAAQPGAITDPQYFALGSFYKSTFKLGGPGAC